MRVYVVVLRPELTMMEQLDAMPTSHAKSPSQEAALPSTQSCRHSVGVWYAKSCQLRHMCMLTA